MAIGFAWRPADSWRYWGGVFLDSSRVGGDPRTIANQSLRGTLARLMGTGHPHPALWLLLAAAVGVAGLAVSAWAARRGEQLAGVVACATTGVLVSPISWHHHWVWCVPALLLIAERTRHARNRAGPVAVGLAWLGFVATTSWVLPPLHGWDMTFRGWGLVYSNLYVLAGLGALGWLAAHLRRIGMFERANVPDGRRRTG